jgi:translation initiation factor IF-1
MSDAQREEVAAGGFELPAKERTSEVGTIVRTLHGGRLSVRLDDGTIVNCRRGATLGNLTFDPGDTVKVNRRDALVYFRFRRNERPVELTREALVRAGIIRPREGGEP